MKNILKSGLMLLVMLLILLLPFAENVFSNEHSCRYERKQFLTEQLIKHKQNNIIRERSPILIGFDALFL